MNAPFAGSDEQVSMDDVGEYCECRSVPSRDNTGWIDADERMPEEGKVVLVCTLDGYRWTATCKRDQWQLTGDTHILLDRAVVTHWRELPELPRVDAFEAWWDKLRVNNCYPSSLARFVGDPAHQTTVMKQHARIIWEAALASAAKDSPSSPCEPADSDMRQAWLTWAGVYANQHPHIAKNVLRSLFQEGWNSAVLWYARQAAAANSATKDK